MPEPNSQHTLDTKNSEFRLNRFEGVWKAWKAGDPKPDWREHLPADNEPCNPNLIFALLQMDINYRIKAGMSTLMSEEYFCHPRLQREDARLDSKQQVELIRWDYQQRWKNAQRVHRSDYAARFPQHAAALRELKPRLRCPLCRRMILAEETRQTLHCPDCNSESPLPAAPPLPTQTTPPTELDLRGYVLAEALGKGGMGEVYRCCDPALGRDLAIKVMKSDLGGHPEVERRFLREALVTGSLQHPSIVTIHNLGRLPDGRLHYTMRLVRGRTFADILKEEAGKLERSPFLLTIFEKICQAVAYAHSKHVIHRDLKPANVMVGKFGEVQVMDWGLAKLLSAEDESADKAPLIEPTGTLIRTEVSDTPSDLTHAGSSLGTPAYISPEQALGELDTVDERTDVFALGAILCEMLTGEPPYRGQDGNEVLRRARRGDLVEALSRLETCKADEELTALCRDCLSPDYMQRPRDAGAVAQRVAEYQIQVQERLRQAELERVAAEIRAREEKARAVVEQERTQEALRRAAAEMERAQEAQARARAERQAKRRMLFSAAAVLILIAGSGGGIWWQQRKQDQADQAVSSGLAQAKLLEQQAQETPLESAKFHEALEAAQIAASLAKGSSDKIRQRAEELMARLEQEKAAVERDRQLLTALLQVRDPCEGPKYVRDERGAITASAEITAEEQFALAFRAWGIDVDVLPTAEATARLKERPKAVVTEVIAGLDEWASQRRIDGKPETQWRQLAALASALDDEPDSKRSELREILARGQLPHERALTVVSSLLRPVPIPVEIPMGQNLRRLRQLVEQTDPATEPVLGLLTLARALRVAGEDFRAERLLRAAIQARPQNVVLYHTLGKLFTEQNPPRWSAAIECYTAARALRPELGVSLADALIRSGRESEGLKLFDQLVEETPDDPYVHFKHGYALDHVDRLDDSIVCLRKAIALDPKYSWAHNNLGWALHRKGLLDEAIAEYRAAIAASPTNDMAHNNLGWALDNKDLPDEAMAEYRQAIAIDPDNALAHNNLGWALYRKGQVEEAMAEYHEAVRLDPLDALAHINLGVALSDKGLLEEAIVEESIALKLDPKNSKVHNNLGWDLYRKGQVEQAMAEYHTAITLDPKNSKAYNNLGWALYRKGQVDAAITEYHKAIALNPKYALAHNNLGLAFYKKGEAEKAMAQYRKAIALDPKQEKAHNNLGDVLRAQGKLDESIAEYRQALQLKPANASYHNDLGNALDDKGLIDEAIAEYREAIRLEPGDAVYHSNLSYILCKKGQVDDAITEARKAIQLKSDSAPAHNRLGWALYKKGQVDAAMIVYHKAIALDPKFALAHNNLGLAFHKKGEIEKAIAQFRNAIALDPQDAWAYYNLATIVGDKGEPDRAIAYYHKAIALRSRSPWFHNNLGWELARKGQLDEAIACYQKAVSLDPKDAWFANNLGRVLRDKGRLDEAVVWFQKAIALDPRYAPPHFNLGRLLFQQGRSAEAKESLRRCLQLSPSDDPFHVVCAEDLRSWEKLLAQEKKLSAVLSGKESPREAQELQSLASFCQHYKRRYAAAARFYADCLSTDPSFASPEFFSTAAGCAALAAAGLGEDARSLPDKDVVMFRRWAYRWMRKSLVEYSLRFPSDDPAVNRSLQQELLRWRCELDFASVREPQALNSLPGKERADWQSLWRDVNEFAKRVAKDVTEAEQTAPKP